MSKREPWKPNGVGTVLIDKEQPSRVVRLVTRVNPQGVEHPPYWVVKNLQSGEETTVLESELGRRYNVPPATAETVAQPDGANVDMPRVAPVQAEAPGAEPEPE